MGLNPTTPESAAGQRIEARVSVPSPPGAIPVAAAMAEPPVEPPGMRPASQGFRLWGVVTPRANSWVSVLPMMIAPAARRRATAQASSPGTRSSRTRELAVVGTPATWITSLTETGTPWRAPRNRPARCSTSSRSASARASRVRTMVKAWSAGSRAATRSSAASTAARALSVRSRIARAVAATVGIVAGAARVSGRAPGPGPSACAASARSPLEKASAGRSSRSVGRCSVSHWTAPRNRSRVLIGGPSWRPWLTWRAGRRRPPARCR